MTEPRRCACADCLALDDRWPDDGWQMMLLPEIDQPAEAVLRLVLNRADIDD